MSELVLREGFDVSGAGGGFVVEDGVWISCEYLTLPSMVG